MKKHIKIVLLTVIAILLLGIFIVSFVNRQNTEKGISKEKNINSMIVSKEKQTDIIGYLTIEKIGMKNELIKEGTDDKVLKNNIGHFASTSKFNGNICIAGHNYGIENTNLFKDLNKLQIDDIVEYNCQFGKKLYKINSIKIIKSTDFDVLENTKENSITMITCVGLRKDIRLCIKAIEIKEELNEETKNSNM